MTKRHEVLYRELPPLNSLKAFHAVAAHGSIAAAARALSVNPSAISRHVLQLEEFLGCKLLERKSGGAAVTASGEDLLGALDSAFTGILDSAVRLRSAYRGFSAIRIATPSTFALKWLIPRLQQFQCSHPGVMVDVATSDNGIELLGQGRDVAVVSDLHPSAGLDVEELFEEQAILACSPGFARSHRLQHLADVPQVPLIHTVTRAELWPDWARHHRLSLAPSGGNMAFQDFYLSIEAAAAGNGLALVPSLLARDDIRSGRLIEPLHAPFETGRVYKFVRTTSKKRDAGLNALLAWLVSELAENGQASR